MAKRPKSPAFQLYVNDFITGTQTLTLAARGAYVTLLCQQWDKGGIPDDVQTLARLLSCERAEARDIWGQLRSKFVCGSDGLFRNVRIEKERVKQRRFRQKMAQNGKKGGRPRNNQRLSYRFPETKPEAKAEKSSLSSSSSSVFRLNTPRKSFVTTADQDHITKSREVKRLMQEEGLSMAAAAQRVGYH
jgi:uncharacterized protein YdaU (DUF1376 family)